VDIDKPNIEVAIAGRKAPGTTGRFDSEENKNVFCALDVVEVRDNSLTNLHHCVA
jgi:hypothetical protein